MVTVDLYSKKDVEIGVGTSQNHIKQTLLLPDDSKKTISIWVVVSNIVYFHPCLGKIPILTNIFQRGGNHQLAIFFPHVSSGGVLPVSACPTETTTS